MPVITFHISADNGSKQYLKDLSAAWWKLQKEDLDTDLILMSGQHQARVHRAVLLPASLLLQELVPSSSCACSTPAVTLPQVQGGALAALVEMIYTGRSKVESKKAMEECMELIEILQMGINVYCEKIISQNGIDSVVDSNNERADDEPPAAANTTAVLLRPRDDTVTVQSVVETFFRGQTWVASIANGNKEKDVIAGKKKREEAIGANGKEVACAENKYAEKKVKAAARSVQIEVIPASTGTKKVEARALEETFQGDEEKQEQTNVIERGNVGKKSAQTIPVLSHVETNQNQVAISSDILDKTTRYRKRKIQPILNISDEIDVNHQPKRNRLELSVQQTAEESGFVNIQDIIAANASDTNEVDDEIFVRDPIKVHGVSDSIAEPYENSEMFIFSSEKPSFSEEVVDPKDDGDREQGRKENVANFMCPFCEKKFYKKPSYDKHLSWNHFKEEICDQFPGLECMVCKKRFLQKSNYVFHLGAFHKIADGLMSVAFASKLAQVNESNKQESLAYCEVPSMDHSSVDTPRESQNNSRTRRSLGREASESGTKSDNLQ